MIRLQPSAQSRNIKTRNDTDSSQKSGLEKEVIDDKYKSRTTITKNFHKCRSIPITNHTTVSQGGTGKLQTRRYKSSTTKVDKLL